MKFVVYARVDSAEYHDFCKILSFLKTKSTTIVEIKRVFEYLEIDWLEFKDRSRYNYSESKSLREVKVKCTIRDFLFHDEKYLEYGGIGEFVGVVSKILKYQTTRELKKFVGAEDPTSEEKILKRLKMYLESSRDRKWRKYVFMTLCRRKKNVVLGTIVIELNMKLFPKSVNNFVNLIEGKAMKTFSSKGDESFEKKAEKKEKEKVPKKVKPVLGYKNTRFFRVNNKFIQGGDVIDDSGLNNFSSFSSGNFESENLESSYSNITGVVGYVPDETDEGTFEKCCNGSIFYINVNNNSKWMDKKFQTFGRVIRGLESVILQKVIRDTEVNENEVPHEPIKIADCGLFFTSGEDEKNSKREKSEKNTMKKEKERKKRMRRILIEEFSILDANNDGFIDGNDLLDALDKMNSNSKGQKIVEKTMTALHVNKDKKDRKLTMEEYVESMFALLSLDEMEKVFETQEQKVLIQSLEEKQTKRIKKELIQAFKRWDKNSDGFVDLSELATAMVFMRGGKTPTDVEVIEFFEKLDVNEDSQISMTEWIIEMFNLFSINDHLRMIEEREEVATENYKKKLKKCVDALEKSFERVDLNSDGIIDQMELSLAMKYIDGKNPSEKEVASVLAAMDTNKDGKIQKTEYIKSMIRSYHVSDLLEEVREENKKAEKEKTKRYNVIFVKYHLSKVFDKFDEDKSKDLDPHELQFALAHWTGVDASFEEVKQLYVQIDLNKDGKVDKVEFVRSVLNFFSLEESMNFIQTIESKKVKNQKMEVQVREQVVESIDRVFNAYDKRKSGLIDQKDILSVLPLVLCRKISDDDVNGVLNYLDQKKTLLMKNFEVEKISKGELIDAVLNTFPLIDLFQSYRDFMRKKKQEEERKRKDRFVRVHLSKLFHNFDINWDGVIDKDELLNVNVALLGRTPDDKQFQHFCSKFKIKFGRLRKKDFVDGVMGLFPFEELYKMFDD